MKLLTWLPAGAVRLLASVVCVSGLAFSNGVLARTCSITPVNGSFNTPLVVAVAGAGVATIGEDTPVGTVLYTSRIISPSGNSSALLDCDTYEETDLKIKAEAISMPSGTPVSSGGLSIYPTNISGIGVTFRITSLYGSSMTMFPDVNIWTFAGLGTDESGGSYTTTAPSIRNVEFDLIKTGEIDKSGTQQVLGASFPVLQLSASLSPADNVSEQTLHTISFTGAVTFHTKTCQIAVPDISVDLGLHPLSDFKAPGTTTEWKSFDITLQNCPPFYGYGMSYRWLGSATAITVSEGQTNKVGFTFNSANGVVEGNPALAKIESGPDAAQGIGIEMTQQDDSTSIPMDGSSGFELQNLTTTDGGTYVIPLRARYVQYDSSVKAGVANGAVVFTITYQ